jgi:alcohol dehydrogenase
MQLLYPFSFELSTRIEYGPGAALKLGDCLEELGAGNILLVTDDGVRDAGLLTPLTEVLASAGIRWQLFDGVAPNPKDDDVENGACAGRAAGVDAVVGVGGGSPIDCAKAIAVLIHHEGKVRDYEQGDRITEKTLPLVAVPTTAGTGSEVTYGAVITDTRERYKFTVKSRHTAPRIALVDPRMTVTMPPALTAATGMDALTHAIEGYTATVAEPLADAAALHAIELIAAHLETAVRDGDDLEARAGMLLGSLLAGIAFSHADVGAVHCIAEALGALYDAPHGVCNAVVLPEMMAYNLDYCRQRYARVAAAMGLEVKDAGAGARLAVAGVRKLAEKVGLPPFTSLGFREADFEEIAVKSVMNGSNPSNPRPMAKEDYLEVLATLWRA